MAARGVLAQMLVACTAAALMLTGCAGSTTSGVLRGHLYGVGGPAPGAPRPFPGSVVANGADGRVAAAVGAGGTYKMKLRPGTYRLTGTSPIFGDGRYGCAAIDPVVVKVGGTSEADVICSLR